MKVKLFFKVSVPSCTVPNLPLWRTIALSLMQPFEGFILDLRLNGNFRCMLVHLTVPVLLPQPILLDPHQCFATLMLLSIAVIL